MHDVFGGAVGALRGLALAVACACLCLAVASRAAHAEPRPPRIVFFNPGAEQDVGMWGHVSHFMRAAARDLGIDLEIIHADRDTRKMMQQARAVAARPVHPDYLMIVNEKQMGADMVALFKGSGSKILFVHNEPTQRQRMTMGDERAPGSAWIGTVLSNHARCSQVALGEAARVVPDRLRVIGITGDRETPVSMELVKGVVDFLIESKRGELLQVAHGDWSRAGGKEKAAGLLARYPEANVVWAANDSMALGALDAVEEAGRGGTVVVVGTGGFPDALASISQGRLKATTIGHVMSPTWALLMLFDHYHGIDFADERGARITLDSEMLVNDPPMARRIADLIIDNPDQIDFRRLSKALNKDLREYDFGFAAVQAAAQ